FFTLDFFASPNNYEPAHRLKTPPDIVPEWYFLPFYAMLRAIPHKLSGVIVMTGAILTLFFVPWLDTSPTRSNRFRPLIKRFFWGLGVASGVAGLLRARACRCGRRRWARCLDRAPGDALLLWFLLADYAARRHDRNPGQASRQPRAISARWCRRGGHSPCPVVARERNCRASRTRKHAIGVDPRNHQT